MYVEGLNIVNCIKAKAWKLIQIYLKVQRNSRINYLFLCYNLPLFYHWN